MRPLKVRLIRRSQSIAMGLASTLLAAPAGSVTSVGPAMAQLTPVIESHRSAGEFVSLVDLRVLVEDGILDWDTALYLWFRGAVEPKLRDDHGSRWSLGPGEDDTGDLCDPHPDIPK